MAGGPRSSPRAGPTPLSRSTRARRSRNTHARWLPLIKRSGGWRCRTGPPAGTAPVRPPTTCALGAFVPLRSADGSRWFHARLSELPALLVDAHVEPCACPLCVSYTNGLLRPDRGTPSAQFGVHRCPRQPYPGSVAVFRGSDFPPAIRPRTLRQGERVQGPQRRPAPRTPNTSVRRGRPKTRPHRQRDCPHAACLTPGHPGRGPGRSRACIDREPSWLLTAGHQRPHPFAGRCVLPAPIATGVPDDVQPPPSGTQHIGVAQRR